MEVKVRILDEVSFRPGMTATVEIQTQRVYDVLSLPIQAVTTRLDSSSQKIECVFSIEDDKKARQLTVTTGIQDDEYIEVSSGIEEEQDIIVGPYNAVSRLLNDQSEVIQSKGANTEGVSVSIIF